MNPASIIREVSSFLFMTDVFYVCFELSFAVCVAGEGVRVFTSLLLHLLKGKLC